MAEERDDNPKTIAHSDEGEMSEAEIDSNLDASFPASDPPSWTLGIDEHHNAPSSPQEDIPAEETREDR